MQAYSTILNRMEPRTQQASEHQYRHHLDKEMTALQDLELLLELRHKQLMLLLVEMPLLLEQVLSLTKVLQQQGILAQLQLAQ